jgi:hypothetical protein
MLMTNGELDRTSLTEPETAAAVPIEATPDATAIAESSDVMSMIAEPTEEVVIPTPEPTEQVDDEELTGHEAP